VAGTAVCAVHGCRRGPDTLTAPPAAILILQHCNTYVDQNCLMMLTPSQAAALIMVNGDHTTTTCSPHPAGMATAVAVSSSHQSSHSPAAPVPSYHNWHMAKGLPAKPSAQLPRQRPELAVEGRQSKMVPGPPPPGSSVHAAHTITHRHTYVTCKPTLGQTTPICSSCQSAVV